MSENTKALILAYVLCFGWVLGIPCVMVEGKVKEVVKKRKQMRIDLQSRTACDRDTLLRSSGESGGELLRIPTRPELSAELLRAAHKNGDIGAEKRGA